MAYAETSRSRPHQDGQHESTIQTVGVATGEDDTGIPALGDYIDAETDLVTGHICQTRAFDPTLHIGRTFVSCTWVGLKDYA